MNRLTLAIVLVAAYMLVRSPSVPVNVRPVTPAVAPVAEIHAVAQRMDREDRDALAEGYSLLSKAVGSDPVDDPVFIDTATLRRAHRAMLLFVWRVHLDNKPETVPGLKEAVEGAFSQRIGTNDVPLNPDTRQSAAKALADIASSFR